VALNPLGSLTQARLRPINADESFISLYAVDDQSQANGHKRPGFWSKKALIGDGKDEKWARLDVFSFTTWTNHDI
jgi:hypothetical protein